MESEYYGLKARTDLRELRNSDSKFACKPGKELISACFAKNAANRNFSYRNFAFYAAVVLTWTRNAINALRISQV